MEIVVREDVHALGIFVAYAEVEGVIVGPTREDSFMWDAARELGSRYTLNSLKEDPVVRAYRSFYWRIGIDPTKTRPSSEAMVRRVLKEGSFPRINNVVDAANVASALTLVPIGLYDLDKVSGTLELRIAREGERFLPIGGGEEVLKGGEPVLADEEGPLFLYPHRDSRRTMITETTRSVLVVGAGVPDVDTLRVRRATNLSIELIIRSAGGRRASETRLAP